MIFEMSQIPEKEGAWASCFDDLEQIAEFLTHSGRHPHESNGNKLNIYTIKSVQNFVVIYYVLRTIKIKQKHRALRWVVFLVILAHCTFSTHPNLFKFNDYVDTLRSPSDSVWGQPGFERWPFRPIEETSSTSLTQMYYHRSKNNIASVWGT